MSGNWDATQMPALPGFYMNFISAALAAIKTGARGTVAMPIRAHWGPPKQFVEVIKEGEIYKKFGAEGNGASTDCLKLAVWGLPKKILVYRLVSSAAKQSELILKDSASTNVMKLKGKYPGERGNDFKIAVRTSPTDESKQEVVLYDNTKAIMVFTAAGVDAMVAAINNDTENEWIIAEKVAAGNGTFALLGTAAALTGGDSGISGIVNQDYLDWLDACETHAMNIMVLDGVDDASIQTSFAAWIRRVRTEGKFVMGFAGGSAADDVASNAVALAMARAAGFNHEGVISVGVGLVQDGVSFSSAKSACYAAGLAGSLKLKQSLSYAPVSFDDVTRRWTKSEMNTAVNNGVFLFIHDGRIVKVLKGINSLLTLRQDMNNTWKKIRAIRVMDAINDDLQVTAEDNYIGKINNTAGGRALLIDVFKAYMRLLAMDGVIEDTGWDVLLDPNYYGKTATLTPDPDQVFTMWDARITDVVEQIFGTFRVH